MKHSSVYVASLPQTLRTNGSCRKKIRRGSTPEHGSVNAGQLPPGTGKTVVFLSVKNPKFQSVRGDKERTEDPLRGAQVKMPMSCPQPRAPYLNGTNHHQFLRWGWRRGRRRESSSRLPCAKPSFRPSGQLWRRASESPLQGG